jgi:hypothetical protein
MFKESITFEPLPARCAGLSALPLRGRPLAGERSVLRHLTHMLGMVNSLRFKSARTCALFGTAIVLASCGDEAAAPLAVCSGSISVRAGSGQNAQFDWTPQCGLFSIGVLAPPSIGGPSQGWTVVSETALIGPGIRHGEAPPGTRLAVPAFQVTPGTGYLVAFTAQSGQPAIAAISWRP